MTTYSSILLAEDEEGDIFLVRRALAKSGLPIMLHVAKNGVQATELLSSGVLSPPPGLFLLDLKMPLMDGFEVLQWLRDRPEFSALPVAVLSSSAVETDVQKATQLGAREYHVKPNDTGALNRLLQQLATRWLVPQFQNKAWHHAAWSHV
jgi:CheY-like chemotaxis protein